MSFPHQFGGKGTNQHLFKARSFVFLPNGDLKKKKAILTCKFEIKRDRFND